MWLGKKSPGGHKTLKILEPVSSERAKEYVRRRDDATVAYLLILSAMTQSDIS